MANICPVSDLRNYNTVLENISAGSPVYLTVNGRGRYTIRGRRSGEEEGYLSSEDVRATFRSKAE